MMNDQVQSFLQWSADAVVGLIVLWIGYTNRRFTHIEDKHDGLDRRVSDLQVEIATFETTRAALERMENKLDELSKLVHLMAGHQGIMN